MKKQRKRPAKKTRNNQVPAAPQEAPNSRRTLLRNGAIGLLAIGGGGFFAANAVMASLAEQDMSKIGHGTPAIVQIHDPNCTSCQQLQRETRAALKAFDEDAFVYLVANIKNTEGATFANSHGATHVTLLLFDGTGRLQGRLQGVRDRAALQTAFQSLIDQNT